jgi:hypothetical protein
MTHQAVTGRAATILASIDRAARIIEIGPSFRPLAPKSDGWNTIIVDHATRAKLVEKYAGQPGVDVSQIEEVDFVWTAGSLSEAIPCHLHGAFDVLIASHVIEHTTDLIGFLEAGATLLSPTGIISLVIPDKRYCFDYFRPLTTTGEVLYAHASRRSRHTSRIAFDHRAYAVTNGNHIAWGQDPVRELNFVHTLEQAGAEFSTLSEDPRHAYVDLHAWQFTPTSFELLMLELARLGKTDWQVKHVTPATGCEFFASLCRGGGAVAAAQSVSELNARRLALLRRTFAELGDQIDFLLAGSRREHFRYLTRRALALLRVEGPILFSRHLGRRLRTLRLLHHPTRDPSS